MNDQHDPTPPTINPPQPAILIHSQTTYSGNIEAIHYNAHAARLDLAAYALHELENWQRASIPEEEARALAYAPPGYYPRHNNRAIEKHNAYCYEIHRDDLSEAAGSVTYYAAIQRDENQEPAIIRTCRDVKENGYKTVQGMILDSFTAAAVLTVYENLNPQAKENFTARPLENMVNITWKVLAKAQAA